jgi:hypothetical protein
MHMMRGKHRRRPSCPPQWLLHLTTVTCDGVVVCERDRRAERTPAALRVEAARARLPHLPRRTARGLSAIHTQRYNKSKMAQNASLSFNIGNWADAAE